MARDKDSVGVHRKDEIGEKPAARSASKLFHLSSNKIKAFWDDESCARVRRKVDEKGVSSGVGREVPRDQELSDSLWTAHCDWFIEYIANVSDQSPGQTVRYVFRDNLIETGWAAGAGGGGFLYLWLTEKTNPGDVEFFLMANKRFSEMTCHTVNIPTLSPFTVEITEWTSIGSSSSPTSHMPIRWHLNTNLRCAARRPASYPFYHSVLRANVYKWPERDTVTISRLLCQNSTATGKRYEWFHNLLFIDHPFLVSFSWWLRLLRMLRGIEPIKIIE